MVVSFLSARWRDSIGSDMLSFMAPSSCFRREQFGGWCMFLVEGIQNWGMFLGGGILERVHVSSCMITSSSVIHAWKLQCRDSRGVMKTPSDLDNVMYLLACLIQGDSACVLNKKFLLLSEGLHQLEQCLHSTCKTPVLDLDDWKPSQINL